MRCHSVACGYAEPNAVSNAIKYAKFRSRSQNAVIRVYDQGGNTQFAPHGEHVITYYAV